MTQTLRIKIILFSAYYYAFHGFIIQSILPALTIEDRILTAIVDSTVLFCGFLSLKGDFNKLVKVFLSLVLFSSSITFLIHSYDLDILTHLNGLRDILLLFSFVLILNTILRSEFRFVFFKKFTRFLIFFVLLQIPISFYQFYLYGAGDYVGGSLGAGSSGILTQLLFLIAFYFLVIYAGHNNESFVLRKMLIVSLILIPTFINETKITFILLIVYFYFQINIRKNLINVFAIILFSVLIFIEAVNIYSDTTQKDPSEFVNENFLNGYLFKTKKTNDITRFGKVVLVSEILNNQAPNLFFGLGFGILKGQNILGQTTIGQKYAYLYRGSRTLIFECFFQGGLSFLILFFLFTLYLVINQKSSEYHNLRGYKWFIVFSYVLSWFYNPALLNNTFSLIFIYLLIWPNYLDINEIKFTKSIIPMENIRSNCTVLQGKI